MSFLTSQAIKLGYKYSKIQDIDDEEDQGGDNCDYQIIKNCKRDQQVSSLYLPIFINISRIEFFLIANT